MVLPNFLVIGAYKSGTTSLHRYLRQHPDVYMPKKKEPNFFAHEEKRAVMALEEQSGHIVDTMDEYQELFEGVRGERAIGEASPIYMSFDAAAQRIYDTLPDVKLVAILRQPIDAFLSEHHMRIRDRRAPEAGFRERVEAVARRIDSGERAGPLYFEQLESYYRRFSREQIKVILFEDLIEDVGSVMRSLFEFLDVDPGFEPITTRQANTGSMPRSARLNRILKSLQNRRSVSNVNLFNRALRKFVQLNSRKYAGVSPDLRRELTRVFADDILKLQALIGRDLSHWLH